MDFLIMICMKSSIHRGMCVTGSFMCVTGSFMCISFVS